MGVGVVRVEMEDADRVKERTVNNGQVYLGRDLDGKTVKVAVEVVDDA